MDFYSYVDLAIAFIFVILLLSIVTSGINEVIMYAMKQRGKFLKKVITMVFNDSSANQNYADQLYAHPILDAMKKNGTGLQSYISSGSFAAALIDIVSKQVASAPTDPQNAVANAITNTAVRTEAELYAQFRNGVAAMKPGNLQTLLKSLTENSNNLAELRVNLAKWFDNYMDRVSGWYKSKIQLWLFIIGFGVALFLNVNTFTLIHDLYHNSTLRQEMAASAEAYMSSHLNAQTSSDSLELIVKDVNEAYDKLNLYDLPIGWNEPSEKASSKISGFFDANSKYISDWHWLSSLFGWLVTAGLLSFGAPFWFQLLNKLIDLRKAGKKPDAVNQST